MRWIFVLLPLTLVLGYSAADAASADYDGKWLSEETCSANTGLPSYKALSTPHTYTIENGSWTDFRSEIVNGIQVEIRNTGHIQDGYLVGSTDLKSSFGESRHLSWSGQAISAFEIVDEGIETVMTGGSWTQIRVCHGKQSMIEPSPVSLAGAEHGHQSPSKPVPAPLPVPVPTASPRPSPVPQPIPGPTPVPGPAPAPSSTSIACQKFPNLCP